MNPELVDRTRPWPALGWPALPPRCHLGELWRVLHHRL